MALLPVRGYLSDNARTEAEQKQALEDQRDALAMIAGAGLPIQALTLATDDVTPAIGLALNLEINVESGATDDLDHILITNVEDGAFCWLHAGNAPTEDIVVKDAISGSGRILLTDSVDFTLDTPEKAILLQLVGADWIEVMRVWGNQTTQEAAFRTFFGFGSVVESDLGVTGAGIPTAGDLVGERSIGVPATAMEPATTDGAGVVTKRELTAGQAEVIYRAFSGTGTDVRHVLFTVPMPKSWDEGAIDWQVHWSVNSVATGTVVWELAAVAVGDGDPIDAAFGTAETVTDNGSGTANDQLVSALQTGADAVTPGGTPVAGDLVTFRLTRRAAADTITDEAQFQSISLVFRTDALTDA